VLCIRRMGRSGIWCLVYAVIAIAIFVVPWLAVVGVVAVAIAKLAELRRSPNSDLRFRELAENIDEAFWVTNPQRSELVYMSPAFERIWCRPVREIFEHPEIWVDAIHPDDRERVLATLGGDPNFDFEYRIIRPDGAIRHIRSRAYPVRNSSGVIVRSVGLAGDITARVELEAQLRQTQKLESLGLLAGGIAHDFNNVLAVIASNVSLIGENFGAAHPDRELVDDVEVAVSRATSLTRQLLAFSRKQAVEPVVLDLNRAVEDTRKMLCRMLGEDVALDASLDPELERIRIDRGYLVQIIMNLAVNARDAMPRGGQLRITTRNVDGSVMLEIGDTGCGMRADVVARVFEPFFTTKDVGRGTGLGLSVVHGIVQQAGGRIELDSTIDVGTRFRIFFPAVDAPADDYSCATTSAPRGSETILVVDDDAYVRVSTSRLLRNLGYRVVESGDADAALVALRANPDIDLLVTDVVMPKQDGRELAGAARRERPELKVLYTSGYTDDAILHHGVDRSSIAMLEKPFTLVALANTVRTAIDGEAHAGARHAA
jgi:two-component system, cell cycle sensor histidine kinase and response regulator CckA